jgi:hypothetical protein
VEVQTFIAHVEVRFDADTVKAGGGRLNELTNVARSAGFYVTSARIEPAPPDDGHHGSGWVQYAPPSE